MILCDIGNTYFHFYYQGRIWKEPISKLSNVENRLDLYFISVNEKGTKKLLTLHPKAVDISNILKLDTVYVGLGIDRKAACKAVSDGVIVDAGSAITVDIMQDDMHLGGYILPGIGSLKSCYASISTVLNLDLNLGVDLGALPQNTKDAISYGVLKSILLMIKNSCKSKKVYFTGGDGKFLARFFENSICDESLVFKGMLKAINENIARR